MTYLESCMYIFKGEGLDWFEQDFKNRKRERTLARQICMYIGKWHYPELTLREIALPFGKDHVTVLHAVKQIDNLIFSDLQLRSRLREYETHIRESRSKEDLERLKRLQSDELYFRRLQRMVSEMEIVAKAYCLITGSKLINQKENDENQNQRSETSLPAEDGNKADASPAGIGDNA